MIRYLPLHPSKPAVLLIGSAMPVALLLGILAPHDWPFGAAYLLAILLLMLLDAIWMLRDITVEVAPLTLLQIGIPSELDLVLDAPATRSTGRRDVIALELTADVDLPMAPIDLKLLAYQPGSRVSTSLPLIARRRGTARLHRLWLRWSSPYGLMRRRKIITLDRDLHVLTNTHALRRDAVKMQIGDPYFGDHVQKDVGIGSEFDSLRDYAPGLDRRTIDWKHSARHRRLVSKEFRAERNHQIILAIDTGHLMREPLAGVPKLDHAITAGLMLAYASLKSGDRVGLFAFDAKPRAMVAPGPGLGTFAHLQRTASEIAYSSEETNLTLGLSRLAGDLPRRSLIVLITDFIDTVTAELMVENVTRLAKRHLILFVTFTDPVLRETIEQPATDLTGMAKAIVAAGLAQERQILFERLRRLGVHCLETGHDRLGGEMISRYLVIKRRELI
jgi:uncharacterized protein (DUF58 family)